MQVALANLLIDHFGLRSLLDNRVFWDEYPQGLEYPGIVMFHISGRPGYHMQGSSGLVPARVQFDCRGASADEARLIAEALEVRLGGFRGRFDGIRFDGAFKQSHRTRADRDGPSRWFTASTDYIIWWSKAA